MNCKSFVLIVIIYTFLFSCSEDKNINPIKIAQIAIIIPNSGKVGDIVTISGINFGKSQDSSFVTFNNTNVTEYLSWSDSEIKVKVPTEATTGKVIVTVNNLKSNDVEFVIKALPSNPTINEIGPNPAKLWNEVTIIGINFGTYSGSNYVFFNDLPGNEYITWSDTLIKVIVPTKTKSGFITVIVNGVKSNKKDFILSEFIPDEVKIGDQIWMTKNLDVDHFRNGDKIPQITDSLEWNNSITGAWCYYNNDPVLGAIYGKLYNWYALNDPRGLAPNGWHLPNNIEWKILNTFMGGTNLAGGNIKETDTTHWIYPNTGATNVRGFTALPGGYRSRFGGFSGIGGGCAFWSTTANDLSNCWSWILSYHTSALTAYYLVLENDGCSVRCIKDK